MFITLSSQLVRITKNGKNNIFNNMDITKATPKFLLSLAKNFIASENITYEDTETSYFESADTTEYSDQIFKYLRERGFTKHRNLGMDKFFYTFIKQNRDYIFDEAPITDYSVLVIPEIKYYTFNWEVVEIQTVDATYKHTHNTYLDLEDAEEEVRFERDQGNIYYNEGNEISYDVRSTEIEDDSINRFRQV